MSISRFIISVVAVFIFALLWNGLVHMVILGEANQALLAVARPTEDRNMAIALMLTLGIALIFVWSFYQWAKTGSLREGLLHGVFFAILAGLFVDLNQYLIYPLPAALVAQWFVFGTVEFLCYGLIVAALYHRKDNAGYTMQPNLHSEHKSR